MPLINKCLFQFRKKKLFWKTPKQNNYELQKSVRITHTVIVHIFLLLSEYKLGFIFPTSGPTNAAIANDHFNFY